MSLNSLKRKDNLQLHVTEIPSLFVERDRITDSSFFVDEREW